MSAGPSYGRDFGVPRAHPSEPGFEGQPPPERRGLWFWLTAAIGALLGVALFGGLGHLVRTGAVDLTAEPFATFDQLAPLIFAAPTVLAFILLIFRPTRGLASGFLIGGAVGFVVNIALGVYAGIDGG